jgi:hypothetical protein
MKFARPAEKRPERHLVQGDGGEKGPQAQFAEPVSERMSPTNSFSSEANGARAAERRG